jgi:hypothetical protein
VASTSEEVGFCVHLWVAVVSTHSPLKTRCNNRVFDVLFDFTDIPELGPDNCTGEEYCKLYERNNAVVVFVTRTKVDGEYHCALAAILATESTGNGLFALADLPRGTTVAGYHGQLQTLEEVDDTDTGMGVRHCHSTDALSLGPCQLLYHLAGGLSACLLQDATATLPAVYVNPETTGSLIRLANGTCSARHATLKPRSTTDPGRNGLRIMRLQTTRPVQAGEELVWCYGATTVCKLEHQQCRCLCAYCNEQANQGKPRGYLYALASEGVKECCGRCDTCRA